MYAMLYTEMTTNSGSISIYVRVLFRCMPDLDELVSSDNELILCFASGTWCCSVLYTEVELAILLSPLQKTPTAAPHNAHALLYLRQCDRWALAPVCYPLTY